MKATVFRVPGFNRLPCCRLSTNDERACLHISIPFTLSCFLASHRLVDESPRWLFAHGRHSEADEVVRRMLARNGKADAVPAQGFFDAEQLRQVLGSSQEPPAPVAIRKEEGESGASHGIVDLFRTPRLRLRTLNVAFNW